MASYEESTAYPSRWRLSVVIISIFFGTFLIALDTNDLNVAVPKISADFHTSNDAAWYGTAYLVTTIAFQLIHGTFYTFFDATTVYRSTLSMLEGMSPNPTSLIT
jgi:MFS family permease